MTLMPRTAVLASLDAGLRDGHRAAMIEGPDRIAIELVEIK